MRGFREREIQSRVEGLDLVIEFEPHTVSWWQPIRRVTKALGQTVRMELIYNPDRVINRIGLQTCGECPLDLVMQQVGEVMYEFGYLSVGETITEREIVYDCCTPGPRLLRKLQALEELNYVRDCGHSMPADEYYSQHSRLIDEIEELIIDSHDFADPDFMRDEPEDAAEFPSCGS